MKRKIIAILLLSILSFSGCLADQAEGKQNINDTDKAQNEQISALQEGLKKVPSVSQYNDLSNRVTAVEQDKSTKGYTEEEVDDLIDELKDDIEALKDDIDDLESQIDDLDGNTTSTSSLELIDTDRSLKLYLERVSPSSDPVHLGDGGDDVSFDLVIKNTDNDHHDFQLSLWLEPEDNTGVSENTTEVDCYPTLGNWTVTRNGFADSDRDKVYFAMDNDEFISDGETEDFTVIITIDATVDTFWSWRWTIEETD